MKNRNEKEIKKNKSRPSIEKRKRKQYSEDDIKKALDAIKNGMAKKQAAKKYQVPRATLQFRIKNPKHKLQPGPSPVLNTEEENKLKNWLNVSHRKGFPKRKEDLLKSVSEYITKTGRSNPFRNNIPGDKWFHLFLKRHPDIAIRTPEAVTAASAAVSESDIKGWFQVIEAYLKEHGLSAILSDPKRVLNGDETNFVLCAKTGLVLAPKGAKNVYEVDHAPAKSSLTVMFTFSANGEITPPMVIFPYKRLPSEIAAKIPSDWGIGLSDNGWMKTEIFSQYIEKVLHPHLVRNQVTFPVILFVDGHKTHLTYAVSELCSSLDIVLIALYPNCTRMLQPADVAAFRPLKGGWQKTVLEWRRDNPSQALTKVDFVPLLQKTIDKCVKPDTIINGFRATGLCPWDSNAIDYSKCLGKNFKTKPVSEAIPKTTKMITKEDFIRYAGQSTITELINKQHLTAAEKILKDLWYFFDGNENQPTQKEKYEERDIRKPNENSDSSVKDNNINEEICEKNTMDFTLENEYLDIENMKVMMCDEFYTCSIPVAEEIVIDSKDTEYTQTCEQVTHNVQIEPNKEENNRRIDKPIPLNNLIPTHKVVYPDQQDFDKIEVMETVCNPTFTTPIKTKYLRTIELDDVLVLPKTPQRKGMRQSKKTPYVITSKEFKDEELQKIKAKKEKEEGIQKRKEQRQQKQILAKTKQMLKKEEKTVKKRVVKKHETTEPVKRKLLSKDFSNLNIDIALKNEQEKNKNDCKVNLIQERNNKEEWEINKENSPKEILDFNTIKIKKEKCGSRKILKNEGEMVQVVIEKERNKPKIENKQSLLKSILYSEEESDDDGHNIRDNQKLSKSEIEKMLIDD